MTRHITSEEIAEQKIICDKIKELNCGCKKKANVTTLGCVQNENDSEKIRGMLVLMGYEITDDSKNADVVIFNTCAVRENAELKVFGFLGAMKKVKEKNPDVLIGVCGCMIQQNHIVDEIKSKYKHVDMIFGTHSLYRFPQILYGALRQRIIDIEETDGYVVENLPQYRGSNIVGTVSVMYGCNNFCSYCIVPYVRGRERSRAHEDILAEVKGLAELGYKEIMLTGQNVNSYGKDCGEIDFSDLLNLVSEVEGIERIRFVSAHPKDVTDKLIETIANNPKVCKQLHLPFQSGSTKVLADMNRKYTKEQYLALAKKVQDKVPDIALSADIIVGFPTETTEDFKETLDVVKTVGFDMLYTFIYSKRKGTPAAEMEFVIGEEEIKRNFDELVEAQAEILYNKNIKLQQKILPVLVEGSSKTNDDMLTGRTESGKIVNFAGSKELVGKIVNVKIERTATWSLTGVVVE